jgi:hypothetical protein
MRNRPESLFAKMDVYLYLENEKAKVKDYIERLEPDYLLKVSEPDLIQHIVDAFRLNVPKLLEGEKHAEEPMETKVDVTGDIRYGHFGSGRTIVDGTLTTVVLPFEGDVEFFHIKPQTYTYPMGYPTLAGNELRFEFTQTKPDAAMILRDYERAVAPVRDNLNALRESVNQHHAGLPAIAKEHVDRRKKRLLEGRGLAEGLGIPIRRREGAPQTYKAPVHRKKVVTLPTVEAGAFRPEPKLEESVYQEILGIIASMAHVMEYSPRAFEGRQEEDLRFQFLVQLNGQFQGLATGETFNYDGKTDILIRIDGRNVFIAECKFWKGEKAFLETIDQLLSYLSWRDTKAAIIIFNRNVNFTDVLQTITAAVPKHPHFKREERKRADTSFRYVFGHPEDKNRELTVTVMAFNVPVRS